VLAQLNEPADDRLLQLQIALDGAGVLSTRRRVTPSYLTAMSHRAILKLRLGAHDHYAVCLATGNGQLELIDGSLLTRGMTRSLPFDQLARVWDGDILEIEGRRFLTAGDWLIAVFVGVVFFAAGRYVAMCRNAIHARRPR
jgi:hypothetical protein